MNRGGIEAGRLGWIVATWVLGAVSVAWGFEMDIRLDSVAPRALSPIPVEVTLKGDAPVAEGRLHIRLRQDRALLLDYQTEPLVVTSSARKVRLLLPPMAVPQMGNTLAEWDLSFETATDRFEAKGLAISVPDIMQTVAMMAVVHPQPEVPPRFLDLVSQGRLEKLMGFDGVRGAGQGGVGGLVGRRVLTWMARLKTEDLASQALGYCGYDLVICTPASLNRLTEFQIDAMRDWVRAGGSVLLLSHPEEPERPGVPVEKFLEAAASEGLERPLMDPLHLETLNLQLRGWKWDLGRLVHLHGLEAGLDFEHPEWRKLFSFLWKVRYREDPDALRTKVPLGVSSEIQGHLRSSVFNRLMPREVSVLPVSQIGLMMALFLVVIGPLEYHVLRRLRRRWLTWLVFPLTIVSMTWVSFAMAQKLLGGDVNRTLTWVELGRAGDAVRSHEVTLRFAQERGTHVRAASGTLVSPVTKERLWSQEFRVTPFYQGRYPNDYTVSRPVRQWDPYLESAMSIPSAFKAESSLQEIDWERFRPGSKFDGDDCAQLLSQALRQLEGLDGVLYLAGPALQPAGSWGYAAGMLPDLARPHRMGGYSVPHEGSTNDSYFYDAGIPEEERAQGWVPFPRPGAPRGDRYLLDWPVVDHDQWLLTCKRGDDRVIYRYLYPNND